MKNFSYKDLIVLHEDNHVLVVVKPQNVPSQADSSKDKDMLTVVKEYIKNKYDKKGAAFAGLVHRLDRPTGGVMVFAKTSKAAERLAEQMQSGEFEKEYLCITCKEPQRKKDTLVNYLKKNEKENKVEIVPMATDGAKKAILHYETLTDYKGFALVRVKLETGRSHQIRVQMSNIGAPLYGDQKYGADEKTFGKNLALWATKLSFNHPVTKQKCTYIVYPPTDEAPWKAFDINRYLNVYISQSPYEFEKQKDLLNFSEN